MNEPEQKYSIGDTLPIDLEPNVVLDIVPIKHGTETRGWLYCCGDDYDERYTLEDIEGGKNNG